MRIISLLDNKKVLRAAAELDKADAGSVVRLAEAYLAQLNAYCSRLRDLRGIPEIDLGQKSELGSELVEQSRKLMRSAIEETVKERSRVEDLRDSLTMITSRGAAEIFNRFNYGDSSDWESKGSQLRSAGTGRQMSVAEAVDAARTLLGDEYAAEHTTPASRSSSPAPPQAMELEEINAIPDPVRRLELLQLYVDARLLGQRDADEAEADDQLPATRDETSGMMSRTGRPAEAR